MKASGRRGCCRVEWGQRAVKAPGRRGWCRVEYGQRAVKAPDRSTGRDLVRASLTRARRFAPRPRSVQCYRRWGRVERSAPFSPTRKLCVPSCCYWSSPGESSAELEPGGARTPHTSPAAADADCGQVLAVARTLPRSGRQQTASSRVPESAGTGDEAGVCRGAYKCSKSLINVRAASEPSVHEVESLSHTS
jgi:hypothetical protein